MSELATILHEFGVKADALPHGNGHINRTYLVDSTPRVILQRINTAVFKKPEEVMENIMAVTSYLRERIAERGGDPDRETLTFLRARDGKPYYKTDAGDYYRAYRFVEDTVSLESADTPADFAEAAHGFGRFQQMLADFPADKLYETIELFHDTANRFRQLDDAIAQNASGRAADVQAEIDFAMAHRHYATMITDAIADGSVPLRVTHNDTKLNNVLLDAATRRACCVIDLDTVMPGSVLYDFGDALRFGASTGAEDEQDLDKIHFDLAKFEAFTAAFLSEVGADLTARERELLPVSVLMMTLECGIRFLADHINGDVYFGIHRENHNLDRARTQFKLVYEIEQSLGAMSAIVGKY
ncbi:MAG: aminoglycoside phosphotransferase family protein [Clostridia bacterium]|nr:aminoglycoside phosphotransferase family protein [Clostridia bacterium]